MMKSPLSLFFSQQSKSFSLSSQCMFFCLLTNSETLLWTLSSLSTSFSNCRHQAALCIPGVAWQFWAEWDDSISAPSSNAPADAAQDLIYPCCYSSATLFILHQIPFNKAGCAPRKSWSILDSFNFSFQLQDFPLVFVKFLPLRSSNLPRTLCKMVLPSGLPYHAV